MNETPKKMRLDELLLAQGLCANKIEAHGFIRAGKVIVDEQRVDKPGTLVVASAHVRIKKNKFVSRGGEKLSHAVEDLGIAHLFKDAVVLDIGASTGGFTDCSLKLGASLVVALDVGTSQLVWELRNNPKVISLEQTDIRDYHLNNTPVPSMVLVDVSFNSICRLLPDIIKTGNQHTAYIFLVKPQFELEKFLIPKGGVITDPHLWEQATTAVKNACLAANLLPKRIVPAKPKGRFGNQEFFIYASPEG